MENSISGLAEDAHPLDVAARAVGGRNSLARILGVSAAAIGNWKTRGVPFEHCMPIERATNGVVTRCMLRPDDWRTHWPELANTQAVQALAAIETVAGVQAAIKHIEAVAVAEIKHVAKAQAAVKTEANDFDAPVKLPPLASTEVADSLELDERRKAKRRLKQQPFTGPDKRVGPPDRRGFKLPEVAAVLPEGL